MKKAMLVLVTCAVCLTIQINAWSAALENAKVFAEIGDWENGIKYLEEYILQNPKDAEARLLLAECYFNWPDKQMVGDRSEDKNFSRGKAQIRILGRLGDEGMEMLLKGLRSDTRNVVSYCREIFMDKKDRGAIDDLIQLSREKPESTSSVIYMLRDIELGRGEVDRRVVEFLVTVLDNSNHVNIAPANVLAQLNIKDARPHVERMLALAIQELREEVSDEKEDALDDVGILLDSMVRLSDGNVCDKVRQSLNKFDRRDLELFYPRADSRNMSNPTLLCLAQIGLDTAAEEDLRFWTGASKRPGTAGFMNFLREIARGRPEVLLDSTVLTRLHTLCDSPHTQVRTIIIDCLGRIQDETSLDILLPRLKAQWIVDGYRVASLRARSGKPETFLWGSEEIEMIWDVVKSIGSPKTTDFLLDKLASDDVAWTYTATALLHELGEGGAVDLFKKRYGELSGKEDMQAKIATRAIADVYQSMTGRPIAEGQ